MAATSNNMMIIRFAIYSPTGIINQV